MFKTKKISIKRGMEIISNAGYAANVGEYYERHFMRTVYINGQELQGGYDVRISGRDSQYRYKNPKQAPTLKPGDRIILLITEWGKDMIDDSLIPYNNSFTEKYIVVS